MKRIHSFQEESAVPSLLLSIKVQETGSLFLIFVILELQKFC